MKFSFTDCRLGVLVFALGTVSLRAQTVEVPRSAVAPGAVAPDQLKPFDTKHLAERPYAFDVPKPQYPSTERVQREFVVEYVYDYAESRYTPEVPVAVIPRAQVKRDTPENAVNAFFSAMETGDYEAWLACWDAAARKDFEKDAVDQKHDAAYWKQMWVKALPAGVKSVMLERIETQNYIIIDVRIPSKNPFTYAVVLHLEKNEWKVTNDLQSNPMFTAFRPSLAGQLNLVPPLPINTLPPDSTIAAAQEAFVSQHTTRDRIVQAGR
jgi:hypothetical protein